MSSVIIAGNTSGTITLDAPAVAGTTTLTLPATSGTVLASGTAVTVAQGGTGASTLTANNVILGNGTSAVQLVAPSTNGNVLTSNGTTWTSAAAPSSTPTTAQVLTATAGANAGDVGTYAIGGLNSQASNLTAGTNYAGSSIRIEGIRTDTANWSGTCFGGQGSTTGSGTWKLLSNVSYSGTVGRGGLFLRIS
jgi:hypothetical protein